MVQRMALLEIGVSHSSFMLLLSLSRLVLEKQEATSPHRVLRQETSQPITNVCSDGDHGTLPRSDAVGTQSGLAHHSSAGDTSGSPPAYVDDGTHAQVSDVEFA
ncbi:hypothetical protein E4U21_002345 [Claviceps maximensis]|nr:hypothetical protein E4U21_002345 [Claviceps maximensis]